MLTINTPLEALRLAEFKAGGPAAFREAAGVTKQRVSQWMGGAPIPIDRADRIEKETGVPASWIRPDQYKKPPKFPIVLQPARPR